jgi:large subunit ribosomal protein L28
VIASGVWGDAAVCRTDWPAWQGMSADRPILPAMAKICHVCAKGPSFGNNRSHSMVATRRRFDPNLQRVRIDDGGTPRRVYVCTRCLKAGKVAKAR